MIPKWVKEGWLMLFKTNKFADQLNKNKHYNH